MIATTEKTVGQITAEAPGTARVFERYGIDFCCGGNRSLGEVCREKGIAREALLEELNAAAGQRSEAGRDWTKASLRDLIEHIVGTHHAYLKVELPVMQARTAKVVQAHGGNHPELRDLAQVFEALKEELDGHLRKEEIVLFPYIAELDAASEAERRAAPAPFGTVNNPIRMMMFEHDNAGSALERMRRISNNYTVPEDGCNTYRALYHELQQLEADLHIHIHLENNILFPRAAALEEAPARR